MMHDREHVVHVWATELAKRLPEDLRASQAAQYVAMLDAECGGIPHLNLVGQALRSVRGAIPVAAVRTAAHDIADPEARTPTEASARECPACSGTGFAGAWWLRTPGHGRPARMERVAITAATEGLDPRGADVEWILGQIWRGNRYPALASKVPGFPRQEVHWAVGECACPYGQHLARLRTAREGEA